MLGASGAAFALPPAPSKKPPVPMTTTWLADNEFRTLANALDDADNNRWLDVRNAQARLTDPGAKLLLQWRMASDGNSGMGFADLADAVEQFKGWPEGDKIRQAAEITIATSKLGAQERIDWLKAHGIRTGYGILAMADAYNSLGKQDEMNAVARDAFRTREMDDSTVRQLQTQYGSTFTSDDYFARVDMLLWKRSIKDAQALYPKLDSGHRKLAEARVGLMQNKKSVDPLVQAVPDELQEDPGLLLERARWRERRGQNQGELEMLLKVHGTLAAEAGREAIWSEKQSVVRRLIRERDYVTAYQLAADHGLKTGEAFRDAEWLAGWLALRKLNDPAKGERHFRTFVDGVTAPISVARGQYWLGEALMAEQRADEAQVAYLAAAKYPFVFYGQLAAEKVAAAQPTAIQFAFEGHVAPTDEERAAFAKQPAVRAAILLAETGRLASFERFSYAMDDVLASPVEHQMLYDICQGYLENRAALRGAKAGLARGMIAPDALFPILSLPPSPRTGSAEPAMVLALSRQESEFNPRAISGANARGLMQMVPRYAQAEAKKVGISYRTSWLTDDPTYNLRLGRGFLDDLVDRFGGSYVLAAAAYNAGPSRAVQWMNDFGDPRGGQVDPVDWIESVPFAETRNYIQRILENTQVYRHRLTGQPVQLRLSEDLKRGSPRVPVAPGPPEPPEPSESPEDATAVVAPEPAANNP